MPDILGPASANAVTVRPARAYPLGSTDTWFRDCSTPNAQDGTALVADFFNALLAQSRTLLSGASIALDNGDDMLLRAVRALGVRYASAGGSAAAITASFSPPVLSLYDGLMLAVKLSANISGATTIAPNGLSATPVRRPDGTALQADDGVDGQVALLIYVGGVFQFLNLAVSGGGGGAIVAAGKVGQLVLAFGDAALPGTLKCNGASVARGAYPDLWAYANASNRIVSEADWQNGGLRRWTSFSSGNGSTTFRLPDLRGEFLRMWDDGRGIDAGRVLGVQQTELLKSHAHSGSVSISALSAGLMSPDETHPYYLEVFGDGFVKAPKIVDVLTGTVTLGESGGGAETRPRNAALTPCIVYEEPA